MFANPMLMSSLFASLLFSIWSLMFIEQILKLDILSQGFKQNQKLILAIFRGLALICLVIVYKKILVRSLLGEEDDSHIWDILRSKFNGAMHTFDTRLS